MSTTKEDRRSGWGTIRAEQVLQDARYALRRLRRDRSFTAAVVLTLGIAMGMSTAIFSVFSTVVLRPLAYPHPDRLVWLSTVNTEGERGFVTGPDFVDWRDRAASFDRLVAYGTGDYTLASPERAARVRVAEVTEDFWDLSGARAAIGRLPRPKEHDVAVLSRAFAESWFPGERDVIGRIVTLNGTQVTIVGVLTGDFRFHLPGSAWPGFRPRDVDLYQPIPVTSERGGPTLLLSVVGRLRAGATLTKARAEIETIRASIRQAHPNPFEDRRQLRTVPLPDQLVGAARSALVLLLGAAVFVLLIACANVGNLLLARASVRRREIAVRVALGADHARVLRQLIVEGLLLAALGSAAGLFFARSGVAAIVQIDPHAIPRLAETTIDVRVLVAVLAACVLMALAFGLAPTLTAWRMPPQDALRAGDRVVSPDLASLRIRKVLVASEIALASMLLIGAGLMLKSAWRMQAYPAGFEPDRVLTATIEFAGPAYSEPWRSLRFVDAFLDRLRTEPGVHAVGISTHGYMLAPGLMIEGDPVRTPEQLGSQPPIMINATSAGLKQIMGFRMSRGRWFTDDEAAAVLNESLARRELGGRDPIGRRIRIRDNGPLLTIVGVVEDVKYSQLDAPAEPEVYIPYRRVDDGLFGVTALILAATDPLALAPGVRRAVADIDGTQAPDALMTLDQRLADSIAPRRLNTFLFSAFAASALVLAIVGIYGVMAYVVTQHLHEIGVRMALGARRIDVARMIIRQGLGVTSIGIIAGVTGAVVLTRLMEGMLYEVQPTDAFTFASVTVALAATAFAACVFPALRAAFVDPAVTLRHE